MPLTNAERQKQWRDKKRAENIEEYRRKERERKQKAYIPFHLLPSKELEKKREKCRSDFKKHYLRKKRKQREEITESEVKRVTRSTEKLTVKLPIFSQPGTSKGTGVKTRYRRALRKAYRDIEFLKTKCLNLEKDKRKIQKRAERNLKKGANIRDNSYSGDASSIVSGEVQPCTPRSKTKHLLKKSGISLKKCSSVHRQLVLGQALIDTITPTVKGYKKKESKNVKLAATILKRYRCLASLSQQVGVSRKKLSNLAKKRVSPTEKKKIAEKVSSFLEREDNCVLLPGKRDVKVCEKVPIQKRVLSDYLHNLHEKFLFENPEVKLSRSAFCKLRPDHIMLTSFTCRRTCLCTYHQNFALKVKAMKNAGVLCSSNPDVFLKEFKDQESLAETLTESLSGKFEIQYRQWRKCKDGDKYRWKEKEETLSLKEFIEVVSLESVKFRAHVMRVQNQYREMRKLRENMPENELLVWMDFAENYGCSSLEEVQSAYWNAQMVSLHTMVVYDKDQHVQSYVAISDILSHNATVVYCILQKLVLLLKSDYPDIRCIHYLTDSPTSQYRNKTIFNIVYDHQKDFGVKAKWNYLEVGHGKGPCDGLGASVKRSADMAVKQQKCMIQDAEEFYKWVTRKEHSTKIKFIKYTETDIQRATDILSQKEQPNAISGTMLIHAVVPLEDGLLATRDLSCSCLDCLTDVRKSDCDGWVIKPLRTSKKIMKSQPSVSDDTIMQLELNKSQTKECQNKETTVFSEETLNADKVGDDTIKTNDWVAAVYDADWYIGKVTDIDENDYRINFLTKAGKYGNTYKFPPQEDEIWVDRTQILSVLQKISAIGKSKRLYKMDDKETDAVINKFEAFR